MDITYKGWYIDAVIADLFDFMPKCGVSLSSAFVFVIIDGSRMVIDVMRFLLLYTLKIKLFMYYYMCNIFVYLECGKGY